MLFAYFSQIMKEEGGYATPAGYQPAGPDRVFGRFDAWFYLHVLLAFGGYAGLALASGAGLLYLLQLRELKDKRFAAGVERAEVDAGIEQLGVDRTEHIQFIIDALKPHADELGIGAKTG